MADQDIKAKRAAQRAKVREKSAEAKSKARGQAKGFMDFVREQGVVGLAVGLAIGTQAGATVKALVEGFINPIVAFVVGSQDGLLEASWNIIGQDTAETDYWLTLGERTLVVQWGAIFSSLITLLAVAAVIYFIVKGFKLDKLDKKKS